MSDEKPKRGLKRGLSALLGDDPLSNNPPPPAIAAEVKGNTIEIPVEHLQSGRYQPRMDFEPEALQDLADSIRAKGILQPILVRHLPEDSTRYEIIAGERRWRAAQLAQIHAVPVLVREFTDQEAAEVALIENLQRRDLSPLEEAEGYRRLISEFDRTQDDLAQALGKSRSHVANMMRLLALPDPVKVYLRDGRLTAGHARALLNAEQPESLAEQIVVKGLNVRQTEKLVTDKGGVKARKPKEKKEKDSDTVALENDLSRVLGLKVEIEFQGRGGNVRIFYDNLEQLDDILSRLNSSAYSRTASSAGYETDLLPVETLANGAVDPLASPFVRKSPSVDLSAIGRAVSDAVGDNTEMAEFLLDESADSLLAELTAETEQEREELLVNPYADEEGEYQLEDDDDDLSVDSSADALMAELAAETAQEREELLKNPYEDEEGEFQLDDEDALDVSSDLLVSPLAGEDAHDSNLLDSSADLLMAELSLETAEEREALLINPYNDEEENADEALFNLEAPEEQGTLLDDDANALLSGYDREPLYPEEESAPGGHEGEELPTLDLNWLEDREKIDASVDSLLNTLAKALAEADTNEASTS